MKMVKKLLAVALAGVLALSVLTGCSNDGTTTSLGTAVANGIGAKSGSWDSAQSKILTEAVKEAAQTVDLVANLNNKTDAGKALIQEYLDDTSASDKIWTGNASSGYTKAIGADLKAAKKAYFNEVFLDYEVNEGTHQTMGAYLQTLAGSKTIYVSGITAKSANRNLAGVKAAQTIGAEIASGLKNEGKKLTATSATAYTLTKYTYAAADFQNKDVVVVFSQYSAPDYSDFGATCPVFIYEK